MIYGRIGGVIIIALSDRMRVVNVRQPERLKMALVTMLLSWDTLAKTVELSICFVLMYDCIVGRATTHSCFATSHSKSK